MGLFLNGILYPFSMMLRTKGEACNSFFQKSVASWIFPTTVFDGFVVAEKGNGWLIVLFFVFFFFFLEGTYGEKIVSGVQEKGYFLITQVSF